jgi:hypothetical protein
METPALDNVKFEFGADCEKAWTDEKTGKMLVRAVASDDRLDLQRDRMGNHALQKMVEAARKGVPFFETHRSVFEFGRTVDGAITEKDEGGKKIRQFVVDVELDGDFPQARKLFKEVAGGLCKRQLSIGGKLNLKNRDAVSVEMTPSGLARTINDLELDHIASTRENQAANPRTSFTEAVAKAIDDAGLAKSGEFDQNVSRLELSEDAKKGLRILEEIGKKGLGGISMAKAPATCPGTEEITPASEMTPPVTGTEEAEKAKTPRNTETPKTPPAQPEQAGLKPDAAKFGQAKSTADIAGDIASILSKKNGKKPFPGAATPFGSGSSEDSGTPMTEEEKAIHDSLWTLRYAVAKQAEKADLGAGEQTTLAQVVAAGPFAPRSGAKGIAPGAYIPDKAQKGDSTDVGTSGVTDQRRNIQAGGEMKPTAPTAKDAFDLTMQSLKETGQLPQSADTALFGKALGEGITSLEKTLVGKFDAAMGAVLEKSTEVSKAMMTVAAEKIMGEQIKASAEITKAIDNLGQHVNEESRHLAMIEARIARVEKAGGVSQGGPVATEDSPRPAARSRGMWGGLFDGAANQALGKYRG